MISVVISTRNPNPERFTRTLDGLARQSLDRSAWELVVVDNGSTPPLSHQSQPLLDLLCAIILVERLPGLTPARLAGIRAARGDILVLVDDDNVLAPDYLATVAVRFAESITLGAAGGPVVPAWETQPAAWTAEFHGLLALRDLGPSPQVARGGASALWPNFAPVGAGLAIRRTHARAYAAALSTNTHRRSLDRSKASLASGGDNDLVFTTLHAGGDVAYFPDLRLTHLIPSSRLTPDYLARLNEGIMRSWVRVLALHGQCPWPPIPRWTVHLRALRAWFRFQAWRTPSHHIRWRGAVGQFQGQADLVAMAGVHGSAAR